MSLPPEQFHIKRRREEEPVETLYIQSELHQKKRRFTDFIFQRVQIGGSKNNDLAAAATATTITATGENASQQPTSTASTPGPHGRVRSPRSVSTSFYPKRASGSASAPSPSPAPAAAAGGGGRSRVNAGNGVPVIRATSPGAEFREERALAAARRKQEEAKRERLKESMDMVQQQQKQHSASEKSSCSGNGGGTSEVKATTTPSFPTSIRRFHISRPSTPLSPLKTTAGTGVSKNSTPTRARAVLVERLTQAPSLRGASILETLERAEKESGKVDTVVQSQLVRDMRPQKRPVVNKAEKKWREQQKDAISAAKEHLATTTAAGVESQDDYLDRLAKDLEQVMLDMEAEENRMDDVTLNDSTKPATTDTPVKPNRMPLKYMPKHPTPRKPPVKEVDTAAAKDLKDEDMDDEYVYDTYIRVPVQSAANMDGFTDPLSDANAVNALPHNIDPTRKDIGVVVITEEDEDLWEDFLEKDGEEEENWDGEDIDSNAEDNPANDYPDEELSSADEHDDPTAIYHRYRHGGSDDEEFDVNYFDDNDYYDSEDERNGIGAGGDDYDDNDDKTLGRARRLQNFYRRQEEAPWRRRVPSDDEDGDDEMY